MKVMWNPLKVLFSWHTYIVIIALAIFGVLFFLSINLRSYLEQQSFTHSESAFIQEAEYNDELFLLRSQQYLTAIESLKGLLLASDYVSSEEWNAFIANLNMSEAYPAVNQIYVINSPEEIDRAPTAGNGDQKEEVDEMILPFGDTDYTISMLSIYNDKGENTDIILPDSLLVDNSIATNQLLVNPVESGIDGQTQHVILLLPYVDKNSNAHVLATLLDLHTLFEEVYSERAAERGIHFIIEYIKGSNREIVYSTEEKKSQNYLEHKNLLSLGGHEWEVTQWAHETYGINSLFAFIPNVSLTVGFAVSILSSLFIYFFLVSRTKSLQIARSDLARSEKRLRTLFENMAQGVVYQDENGAIISANNAAEEILGLSLEHMQSGESVDQKWKPIRPDGSEFPVDKHPAMVALKTGKRVDDVIMGIYHAKDKDYRWIKINAVPEFREGEDKPYQVFTTFDDITKIKKIEETKNDFLSIAAHQLRTPLGGIRWNTEMILDGDMGKLEPELKQAIRKNYETIIRLNKIVDDLLNVSRIDQNRVQDNPKPTDINEVLGNIIKDSTSQLHKKNIKLDFTEIDLPKIILDPQRLQIVLQNLVSNAIRYTPQGGEITISFLKATHNISVTVKDTGIGIDPQELPHIYKKFYRAKNASKMEARGSGLGLYLVKSYIEAWGGSVEVQSEVGKGSSFTITIPLNPKKSTLNNNLKDNPQAT